MQPQETLIIQLITPSLNSLPTLSTLSFFSLPDPNLKLLPSSFLQSDLPSSDPIGLIGIGPTWVPSTHNLSKVPAFSEAQFSCL